MQLVTGYRTLEVSGCSFSTFNLSVLCTKSYVFFFSFFTGVKKNKKQDIGQGTSVEETPMDIIEARPFVLEDYEEIPLDDFSNDEKGPVGAIEPFKKDL